MKRALFIILQLLFVCYGFAQEKHRFEADVKTIKKYDKIYKPVDNPILFVGSSSIRKWNDLQRVFGSYNVINRGIGGAVIDDIIYFSDDLIFDYAPRQIVLYVGENDLPKEDESPELILKKTVDLINLVRKKIPGVPIVYIAMKPSPVRDQYMDKCKKANELIKKYIKALDNASFVDVYSPMVKNGKSRPELFVKDMLHMNADGYKIWTKAVKKKLIKM